MRLKYSVLNTDNHVDIALRDAVNKIVENSLPKILLIGPMSEIFERVMASFTWSTHMSTVLFDQVEHDLVIVNDPEIYMRLLGVISRQSALMFIDNSKELSEQQRNSCQQQLFAYLPGISPRYAHGHVRCLLQLQKSFIGLHDQCPLMLSANKQIKLFKQVFMELDLHGYTYVHTDNVSKFIPCFSLFSSNTSYQQHKVFASATDFLDWKSDGIVDLAIIYIKKVSDAARIRDVTPEHLKLLIVGPKTKQVHINLPLAETRNDYILQIIYYCLEFNRARKRPRFIQIGNIDKLLSSDIKTNYALNSLVHKTLKNKTIKFRNTPVLISDVSICYTGFMDILSRFEFRLMSKLQIFSGQHKELAQVISDMARTTLQQKYRQLDKRKK